ncbi:MAG: hypothetical protein JSS82_03635, partial [Bacteroidetes bacterium]|nr:hypothetical protein [Bacteroidota bacterium]
MSRQAGAANGQRPIYINDDNEQFVVVPVNEFGGETKPTKTRRVFFSYLNTEKGLLLLNFLMNLLFYTAVLIVFLIAYYQGPNEVEHWAQKKFG